MIKFTCFWNSLNVLSDNCPDILTSFDGTNHTLFELFDWSLLNDHNTLKMYIPFGEVKKVS